VLLSSGKRAIGGEMRAVRLAVVVVLLALGAVAFIKLGSRAANLVVGGLLTIVSLGLLVVARVQLGNSFTILPEARTLVTHGLYRRIPDPLFAFLDLALVGVIIVARQPWWFVPWAILVMAHMWASRREAAVLEQAFGDAYLAYRRSTWW
jgi:protein-S-isoprenylcysteine O-methyltransferase Ste14